jgi:outer membrane protein assembly factor BamA
MLVKIISVVVLGALEVWAGPPDTTTPGNDPAMFEGKIISDIRILRKNVFDDLVAGDAPFYYRWANSLHIVTRARIVRNELLFHVGDSLKSEKVFESERNLRMRQFIGEASVTARPNGPDSVDLTVTTMDYWSTKISVFSELGGGDYVLGVAASEVNFLGYGQSLELSGQTGSEEDGYSVFASEPRIGASRFAGTVFYSDFSFGDSYLISLSRPRYSLSIPYGFSASYRRDSGIGRLFHQGEELFRYRRTFRRFNFSSVYSLGETQKLDFYLGYDFDSRDYGPEYQDSPYNYLIPEDETRSYVSPGIGIEMIKYDLARYLDEPGSPEDLTLGAGIRFSIGRSLPEFGADRQATRPEMYARILARPLDRVFIGAGDFIRWWRFEGRNTEIRHRTEIMLYFKTGLNQVLAVRGLTDFAWRQDPTYQVYLGGGNGLRGFSAYEFSGSKLALANLEYRFFTPFEIFTVRFGGAAFFDMGSVWPVNQGIDLDDMKSNVGVGLRFGLTRSSTSRVLRLDLAKSLADNSYYISFGTGMVFSLKSLGLYE